MTVGLRLGTCSTGQRKKLREIITGALSRKGVVFVGEKKKELEQGVGNKYRDPNESERDSQPQKTIVVRGL